MKFSRIRKRCATQDIIHARQNMSHIARFILFLTILESALLSACGVPSSTGAAAPPNADQLVTFNTEGIAVVRGYVSGGSFSSKASIIKIDIPTKVEGIKTNMT